MPTHYQTIALSEPQITIGANGRIGLVALATDLNSETDLRRMLPLGVEIFTNRVHNRNPLTRENLVAMAADITRAAAAILPGVAVDVLLYACTSGSAVIGEHEVARLLQAGRADLSAVPCTNPVTAALAAFASFGARKISVLTPYVESVNRELVAGFQARGIEVINIDGFGVVDDTDMTGITHAAIQHAARTACHPAADLLFISCTALRAAQVVDQLETTLNKPVVTSNQAMVWHALKLINRPFAVRGFGHLFG